MEFRASLILLLAGIAPSQVSFPPAGNALATLAHQPETRVTWSKEVCRLESGESHAIFTVLALENSNQPRRRARGISIDLSWTNGQTTLYLDEIKIQPEKKIFDELTAYLERIPGFERGGYTGYFELGRNPSVYSLNADVNYSALIMLEDYNVFPGLTSVDLSKALGKAIDELKFQRLWPLI
jgi:hypothetical protein